MPLTCIIVDDEPLAVRLLESFVNKTPDLQLAGSFTDSVEAINVIKELKPDLLFLDIQMPDMSGMELAHVVPAETKIIFTTAFKEYAYESYEVSALDFLLKPIRYNKFISAVEKARQWFGHKLNNLNNQNNLNIQNIQKEPHGKQETVFLRVDGEFRQVALSKIIYVCGMKDYVMFYLSDEKRPLITHLTMKSVEDMLPSTLFMRISRSYIVALDKIKSVDRNECVYIGDEIIKVTDAYHEKFISYLNSRFPGSK
ncbi:MAG: response regulator transcription factor [Prevotella sp.]|nr:response regulator transcription factor [Prevotella sp.]